MLRRKENMLYAEKTSPVLKINSAVLNNSVVLKKRKPVLKNLNMGFSHYSMA